jgi:ornithine decarboxylase
MRIGHEFFQATDPLQTPFIIYDLDRIRHNYAAMSGAFSGVDIHYSVKCNAEDRVLALMHELGAGYEVASQQEAELLIQAGVAPDTIICMHPIKSPEFLTYLHAHHIRTMAVDCFEEVEKIARFAPESRLVVRVAVNQAGSLWNLGGKFGLDIGEINQLLQFIRSKNLVAYGLTFQVGSQCESPLNWVESLRLCREIWQDAAAQGQPLQFLSLGGGLPAPYTHPIPAIAEIAAPVMQEIRERFLPMGHVRVAIEPGRSLVADAGILVSSVFGIATRGGAKWAYIETGTYNGLIEAIETPERNFYPVVVKDNDRSHYRYHIGGPSCVTLDTPFENVELPELNVGDRLYILSAGAYTHVCATPFNGFPVPSVYYWQDYVSEQPIATNAWKESVSR